MFKFILGFVLAWCLISMACNPVNDVREDCKDYAQQAVQECTDFYEQEVVPSMQAEIDDLLNQINDLIANFQSWVDMRIEQVLTDAEKEIMTRMGCTPDDSTAHWDCTNTTVCH